MFNVIYFMTTIYRSHCDVIGILWSCGIYVVVYSGIYAQCGHIVSQSRVADAIVDTDEEPSPTSAKVRDYLKDLMVYPTLRGDLEFLEGKVSMSGYSEIVASRDRDESIQTKIEDFFPSRE